MQQKRWNLMRRRECLVPTWRGWLVLLFALAMMGYAFMRGLHPFLAITDSRPGGVLVVEGWAPDYALEAAVAEFRAHPYEKLYVSGGPIEAGAPLVEYKTYAQRGEATLLELGLSSNVVQSVPAPFVRQDRTYASAVTLNRWLLEHGGTPKKLNLISVGPHARRSRLMYDKAFGKGVELGVIAVPESDYDARRWWRSSPGVRNVISEAVAYLYARLLFRPHKNEIAVNSGSDSANLFGLSLQVTGSPAWQSNFFNDS